MNTSFCKVKLFVYYIVTSFITYASVDALQILAIEHIAAKSHWNFMSAVLQSLSENGHNVTVYTPFPVGNQSNYTEISLELLPSQVGIDAVELLNMFEKPTDMIPLIINMTRDFCNIVYEQKEIQELLNSDKSNYDIFITEVLSSECSSYVASKLNLSLIYVIPSPMITYMEHSVIGEVSNPATVSHLMSHHAVPKTFYQRLSNVIILGFSLFELIFKEMELKKIDTQPYDLVESVKPSLVFINTHYITDAPRPLSANLIQVGGIHLKSPNSIPNDILEFIENSPHGVIYFTFGSVISMSTLPDHIQNAFKEAFGQIPQRILWKYEGEMKDKPINVMTSKWFPQRDILLHPNVKLFISHGGISGVYEAVDAGVPVLGFPFFYDQHRNIDNLVEAGMGMSMDLFTIQKDELLNNILELTNNEKYTKNAKITSERFKDRPMSPAESVVYWTEYVVRHNGAPHLKSQAFNLTWYQYILLDVIVVILIFIALVIFITYKVFKIVYYKCLKYSQTIKPKSE